MVVEVGVETLDAHQRKVQICVARLWCGEVGEAVRPQELVVTLQRPISWLGGARNQVSHVWAVEDNLSIRTHLI